MPKGILGKVRKTFGAAEVALVVKNPPANARDARDTCLIPESGRSPGEGRGNPNPLEAISRILA